MNFSHLIMYLVNFELLKSLKLISDHLEIENFKKKL